MEIITFHKCACTHCGKVLEYRPEQSGQVIECPTCHQKSELPLAPLLTIVERLGPPLPSFKNCPDCGSQLRFLAESCSVCEEKQHRNRIRNYVLITLVTVVILTTVTLKMIADRRARIATIPKPRVFLEEPNVTQYRVGEPDVLKDLRPGKFLIERRHNSDLLVATGDVVNQSENTHYNLRVDLDLLDAKGTSIGLASDYMTVLGPREVWHFNARVTNLNAISARFVRLRGN